MKVKDYLRQPGVKWVNHCPCFDTKETCLLAAIVKCYSIQDAEDYTSALIRQDAIIARVREALNGESIIHWNDDPKRTLGDVLLVVDMLDI